jgi:hypothetical protein
VGDAGAGNRCSLICAKHPRLVTKALSSSTLVNATGPDSLKESGPVMRLALALNYFAPLAFRAPLAFLVLGRAAEP